MTTFRVESVPVNDSCVDSREEWEAIVVGSGFGGAVAACRLAQAGVNVAIIERGRSYEAGDFPSLPADSALFPDLTRWSWHKDQGLWDVADLEEMIAVQAAGYGGGSLVYGNVHLRPPASVFDGTWPEIYRGGALLEDFFDLTSFMLEVAPIDSHARLAPALIKPDQLRKVARHLAREDAFFHPPLAISSREGFNVHGREQRACTGCGACCTGCPHTAKNSLDFNYLAVAEKHGARVVLQCEVVDIEELQDHTWSLTCVDHLAARRRRFHTRNLFLCTGSIHSTRLLARARLGAPGRQAQELAGVGFFANADAVGVVYDTTHPQHPSFGPAITTSTVCWDPVDREAFFIIQDGGYARELERLVGVLRGAAWLGRNRLTRATLATVERSQRPAPRQPIAPSTSLALVSPLDNLLSAIAGGAFADVPSAGTRSDWSMFLGEVQGALLLPDVVDRTIDSSLSDWMRRFWPTSWLRPDGRMARALVRFGRWFIRKILGSSDLLADRAFRALLAGANLGRDAIARRVLGYDSERAEHRVVLLAMGRDAAPGVLHYDRQRDRMIADLDLFHLVPRYTGEELIMTEMGRALGGELRTNPAWAFLGKPISVHSQGGCPMSDRPEDGVTTPDGQVHGCEGLYILDGSILCTSVGVNPSATIAAVVERNILQFIRRYRGNARWPENDRSAGALEYRSHQEGARMWARTARQEDWTLRPPRTPSVPLQSEPLGLAFSEVMQGYYAATAEAPKSDHDYRHLETRGRPRFPIALSLDVRVENLAQLFEDYRHEMQLFGRVTMRLPDEPDVHSYATRGKLELLVERKKPYGIGADEVARRSAHERSLGSRYTTIVGEPKLRERREMIYALSFTDRRGRVWAIEGYKSICDDPGLDAWRKTSSLFVSLLGPPPGEDGDPRPGQGRVLRGAGVVHVDLDGFLYHQLPSLRVTPAGVDPVRAMWARLKFAAFFFGTLQRIYVPEARRALELLFKTHPSNVRQEPPRVGRQERRPSTERSAEP